MSELKKMVTIWVNWSKMVNIWVIEVKWWIYEWIEENGDYMSKLK